jgi:hypothetical protein
MFIDRSQKFWAMKYLLGESVVKDSNLYQCFCRGDSSCEILLQNAGDRAPCKLVL